MKNSGAWTMMVDEQIQSYMISFKLTKLNHSNRAFFGPMKLIINFLCQLRLDLSLWKHVRINVRHHCTVQNDGNNITLTIFESFLRLGFLNGIYLNKSCKIS